MKNFDYLVADAVDPALSEYAAGKVTLKAGGIDLLDLMKERIATPDRVLSIGNIKDLSYIKEEAGGLKIGCLTTLADIARSDIIKSKYPGFHTSTAHAATPQIRERATLGGNLCQRPRCWYFRSADFHCLKKGGATCYAVDGENQYHAIFGPGPCHIVHPSNCAPALVAMGAKFIVRDAKNQREIPAADFFIMPDKNIYAENIIKEGEILTEIILPAAPSQSATIELREKQSFDWPIAMASVARVANKWNVVLGAVAPIPWPAKASNDILASKDITDALANEAADAAIKDAAPMKENAYKVQLTKVAVKRALLSAAGKETPQ